MRYYWYICIVAFVGASKSQLGGPIFYRCWFIPSLSPVIILLYIYIDIYIYMHTLTSVFSALALAKVVGCHPAAAA